MNHFIPSSTTTLKNRQLLSLPTRSDLSPHRQFHHILPVIIVLFFLSLSSDNPDFILSLRLSLSLSFSLPLPLFLSPSPSLSLPLPLPLPLPTSAPLSFSHPPFILPSHPLPFSLSSILIYSLSHLCSFSAVLFHSPLSAFFSSSPIPPAIDEPLQHVSRTRQPSDACKRKRYSCIHCPRRRAISSSQVTA